MAKNPLTIVLECDEFHLLPLLAKGVVYHFSVLYFNAGCPSVDEDEYGKIVGMQNCDWIRLKPKLIPVFRNILPKLEILIRKEREIKSKQSKHMQKLWQERDKWYKKAKLANIPENSEFTEKKLNHTDFTPIALPRQKFHDGFSDLVAVNAALKSNKKPVQGWMTEKPKN